MHSPGMLRKCSHDPVSNYFVKNDQGSSVADLSPLFIRDGCSIPPVKVGSGHGDDIGDTCLC